MIKRRQDGSIFMVMFSGFQSTSLCLQLPLVLVLSYLLCKNVLILFFPFGLKLFFFNFLNYKLY